MEKSKSLNKNAKSELLYLSILLMVFSVLFFSKYSSVQLSPVAIEFNDSDYEAGNENCYTDQIPTEGIVKLVQGNYYNAGENMYVLPWYNSASIKTSVYWKNPVIDPHFYSDVSVQENKFFIRLPEAIRMLNLPVVHLFVSPDDFFSNEDGIYVEGNQYWMKSASKFYPKAWDAPANYNSRGNEAKKPAFLVYNDEKGAIKLAQKCKVSISGNATRSFQMKSLRIDAVKKKLNYAFFNDSVNYSSIVLRNGGNDFTKTLISDGVMQKLMQPTNIDVLDFKPCLVYINGVFWGIHSVRNRSDEDFIAEKYQVKKMNVTFFENWNFKKGNSVTFQKMNKFLTDLKDKHTKLSYTDFQEHFDEECFLNYLAAQIFFANTDWPTNNIKAYKIESDSLMTKWKFIFFDLDYGMGYTSSLAHETDMFDRLEKNNSPMGDLYRFLIRFPEFRLKLKNSFLNLESTRLNHASIAKCIHRYASQIEKAVPLHIDRWRKPVSYEAWKNNIDALNDFSIFRWKELKKHLTKHLDR